MFHNTITNNLYAVCTMSSKPFEYAYVQYNNTVQATEETRGERRKDLFEQEEMSICALSLEQCCCCCYCCCLLFFFRSSKPKADIWDIRMRTFRLHLYFKVNHKVFVSYITLYMLAINGVRRLLYTYLYRTYIYTLNFSFFLSSSTHTYRSLFMPSN